MIGVSPRNTLAWTTLTISLVLSVGCARFDLAGNSNQASQDDRQRLAEAQSLRARGLDAQALETLRLAVAENPRLTEAHLGMGAIHHEQGDYEAARRRYETASSIEPNNYEARYHQGLMLQLLGRPAEAVRRYLQALTIAPDAFEANRDIASAYLQQGKPETALPYARRSTRLKPGSQPAWTNLAAIYSLLGRYAEAVDAYRIANEQGPLADVVLLGLADAHIRLGNFSRAINTLNALIISSEPQPPSTAYERLGFALFKMRQYERSLEHYQEALALDPNEVAALNGVGAIYMTLYIHGQRSNDYQRMKTLAAWRKSLRLNPDQPRIVDLLTRYDQ